jgi:hypothetical protein
VFSFFQWNYTGKKWFVGCRGWEWVCLNDCKISICGLELSQYNNVSSSIRAKNKKKEGISNFK